MNAPDMAAEQTPANERTANGEAAVPGLSGEARERRALSRREQKDAYENNKLFKRLARLVGQAVTDYNMIEHGDKVMVCMSGGNLPA